MTERETSRDVSQLRRVARFVRPYWRSFAAALALLCVSLGVELLGPWLIRAAIDGPLIDGIESGQLVGLAPFALAYLGLAVFGTWLGWTIALLTARGGQRVIRDVRRELFSHLLRLEMRFHDRHADGALVTRVTTDVENLSQLVTTGALQTVFDIMKLCGVLIALFFIDTTLALFVLIVVPAAIGVSALFRARARDSYRGVRSAVSEQNAFTGELVDGIRITRAFGRETTVDGRYDDLNAATRGRWIEAVRCFAAFFASVDLVVRCGQAVLLFVGGRRVLDQAMSAGSLVQSWLYFQKLAAPIRELGEKFHVVQAALASTERIFTVLDEPISPPEPATPIDADRGPARIEFAGVSFGYRSDRPEVVQDVSFTIAAGTSCALVGPTGAGKSTLLSLAARLHDPDAGDVTMDGTSLRQLSTESLRQRIAAVPQDPFLFAASLRENVALFGPHDDDAIRDALNAVDASHLIDRLGGLDAELGERGARISQGEKQLIAFARVLLVEPDLLLLDEATASIDSDTETRLRHAMDVALAGRTSLVVAHRLSTVQNADQILVIADGQVAERGRHDELIRRGGRYAEMVQAVV